MRTSFRNHALGLIVIASLGACGGDDDSLTAKEAWDQYLTTICTKAFECKDSYDPTPFGGATFEMVFGSGDAAACKTMSTLVMILGNPDQVQASVDAKRITYVEADAKVCVAYQPPSCMAFWGDDPNFPDECNSFIQGTVQTGQACTIFTDCATQGNACLQGTCQVPPQQPQPAAPVEAIKRFAWSHGMLSL